MKINESTSQLQTLERWRTMELEEAQSEHASLAQMEAVSKQDYTDAVSQARQAEASIAQNNAALRTAQINLRYTRVPAPITGRIGLSSVTEGALVTANQPDPLTTITRLDPVYVDIQESAADLLALRRSLGDGGTVPTTASVRLKLPDGSDYGFAGAVEFSQVVVNQDTGTVTLDWDVIQQQASAATIDGHLLSAGDARRLLCDAQIIPAVLRGRFSMSKTCWR